MKILSTLLLVAIVCATLGCGGEEDASVKGLPALKADPNDKNAQSKSAGMSMPGEQLMMMRYDKNRDNKISPDEFPDGGLDGYDYDGDGTITLEEMKKRVKEISSKGLAGLETDDDETKEAAKQKENNSKSEPKKN